MNRLDYWNQRYPTKWRRSSFLDRSEGYRPYLPRELGFDVAAQSHYDCVPAARTLAIASPRAPRAPRTLVRARERLGPRGRCRLSAARRARLGAMKRS